VIERLALGTVQFGLSYGIANRIGQPSLAEVARIVAGARASGFDTLDTAVAYGSSESRLGEIGVTDWRVITKLPAVPDGLTDVRQWVRDSLRGSLERLGVPAVTGLLLHRASDLCGRVGSELAHALRHERDAGRALRIGVSIYDPSELDAIWPAFRPDLVQGPYSVVDRRLETSGWLDKLAAYGCEVHTRSVFLQGVLLMADEARPVRFARWPEVWSAWSNWLSESGQSALAAALAHALAHPGISRVLVGVDSAAQLDAIVSATVRLPLAAPLRVASVDLDLIEPSRWNAA
jgi:aryl-alcohol dehydrogenase-like predicted oxidoreductase